MVICGGGIIGAATAYYLSQQGVAATVVEREALAAAASGKAGGFLALDWNDSSPVGPLARCAALGLACSMKTHTYCATKPCNSPGKQQVLVKSRFAHVCWHAVCVCFCRRSYALHAELAQRFGRETIGYREVDTIQVGTS